MKMLIRIFAAVVGLWLILLLAGFFLPGHFRVERSLEIRAKPEAIYGRVVDLKLWRQWGAWFSRDPDMQIAYSPGTNAVGSWSRWTSRSQGDGKMTITQLRPPEYFEYRMEFTDMGMISLGALALRPSAAETTRVTMSLEGDLGRSPLSRWMGLFMDKLVGPDFEVGLTNLKRLSEPAAR